MEVISRTHAVPSILTAIDIATLEDTEEDRTCTICTDPLGVAQEDHEVEDPCSLPCGHIIGRSCITQWLMANTTCPLCRRDYKIELSRARGHTQGYRVLAPAAPLRVITPEVRREAQIAQSRRHREEQDPEHEVRSVDLDQPAGDADFLAGLAAASQASIQLIVNQQVEARRKARDELLSPVREAVFAQIHLTETGSNSRRRQRVWRMQEIEAQLDDDLEAQATIISQQAAYLGELANFDQHIHTLHAARDAITHGDDAIRRAHDDILDDTYRVRHLLIQAQAQVSAEAERLQLDIEQSYMDLDSAYIHSVDHDNLDLDEDQAGSQPVRVPQQLPRA